MYKNVTKSDSISKNKGLVRELHVYVSIILFHERFSFTSQKYFENNSQCNFWFSSDSNFVWVNRKKSVIESKSNDQLYHSFSNT